MTTMIPGYDPLVAGAATWHGMAPSEVSILIDSVLISIVIPLASSVGSRVSRAGSARATVGGRGLCPTTPDCPKTSGGAMLPAPARESAQPGRRAKCPESRALTRVKGQCDSVSRIRIYYRRRIGGRKGAQWRYMKLSTKPLRVVVFQEGKWLSAQFLEYDIATQARTLDDLCYELQRIIVGHIATSKKLGKKPFEGVPQAPQKFWDMFARSRIPLSSPRVTFKPPFARIKVPPPELRVAA